MSLPVIAIIGAGNMGTSLVSGLIRTGHPSDKLWISNPSEQKLMALRNAFAVHTTTDNTEAARHANVIIFAVKPQTMIAVVTPLASLIEQHKPLIISIAAGIRTTHILHCLTTPTAIVRAMPNTAAFINCSATALYANNVVTKSAHSLAESILRTLGTVVWIENEAQLDTITALSGCGPAYFFLVMECLQQTAIELGLKEQDARLLTLQTALGAARMAIENDIPLNKLRAQVSSPGGATEKAIRVLETGHLRQLFKDALQAAKSQAEKLSTLLEE